MEIKNIVLDLGGVLIDIDYHLTSAAFEKLGYDAFTEMYSQYAADELFENLETGKISNTDFFTKMKSIKNGVTTEQITMAWNAMLLDFRWSSFIFIEQLSAAYNVFLLSNTNAIHHAAFTKLFEAKYSRSMDSYFTRAYYSHQIGLRKPNQNIFDFILKDASIKANETLFIDDSFNNIETAEKLNWETHLLQKGELIENVIPSLLNTQG